MAVSNALLGRFFSAASLTRTITDPNNKLYSTLKQQLPVAGLVTNQQVITAAYSALSRQYRNEFFFKNTLLNKIVVGRHSVRTAVALRELPVAGSILDFLIINGIGQVYEIKTALDNLERLEGQIASYYQAFKYVTVVTDQAHGRELAKRLKATTVGLVVLNQRNQLTTVKQPVENAAHLTHTAMFKILRKPEYELILKRNYGRLPEANAFDYYRTCLAWFTQLPLADCHQSLLRALKRRNEVVKFQAEFQQVPAEIRELVYFARYQEAEYQRLGRFLTSHV